MRYWGKEREAKGEEACMELTEKRKGSTYIVLGIRKVILQPYAPAHRTKSSSTDSRLLLGRIHSCSSAWRRTPALCVA